MRSAQCLSVALVVGALAAGGAYAQSCYEYTPTSCWFALPSDPDKEPIVFPKCAFHDCEFDHAASLTCPFPSGGTFTKTDRKDCPDFMKIEERKLPTCKTACCGGVVPGTFQNSTVEAHAYEYVADESAGCSYFNYRRAEILDKLLGENIDIVVAGDSMMRQNYLRLVQMMRGRHRIFDYRVHTHASYSYCDEADTFRTASYMADMKQPEKSYLTEVIPEFFARDDTADGLKQCTRGVGRLDFLHAPLFATHGPSIELYLKTANPKRRLVVLSYVGVWTKVPKIPSHYFQTLERVAAHSAGGVVLSLSIPTFREIRVPERAKKYRERNFRMREWVQRQEGRAGFIDYESLSLTPGAPPTTVHDKHYMCYVTWPQEGRGGANTATLRSQMLEVNSFRERLYDNPIGNVWMTEDGECYDEMNRALWTVALNSIMQADTSEENDLTLPRAFDDIPVPIYLRGADTTKPLGELMTHDLDDVEDATALEQAAPPLGVEEDGSDADAAALADNIVGSGRAGKKSVAGSGKGGGGGGKGGKDRPRPKGGKGEDSKAKANEKMHGNKPGDGDGSGVFDDEETESSGGAGGKGSADGGGVTGSSAKGSKGSGGSKSSKVDDEDEALVASETASDTKVSGSSSKSGGSGSSAGGSRDFDGGADEPQDEDSSEEGSSQKGGAVTASSGAVDEEAGLESSADDSVGSDGEDADSELGPRRGSSSVFTEAGGGKQAGGGKADIGDAEDEADADTDAEAKEEDLGMEESPDETDSAVDRAGHAPQAAGATDGGGGGGAGKAPPVADGAEKASPEELLQVDEETAPLMPDE
mmetsp:Transcript_3550/g.10331  ORF Transcript_3550/g.10331 Transcript_3550/m.10331 type:complete len:816 (-) Transcript_3550:2377-4824(-)|eukprot:CAMPEP_0206135174 /NCGR_PEP_ID=MMETSP1473-20131121/515_1 /ASSEMBLY_ACC=CAM_ASM_001109 /TAXON_ID=1461547 /ORGANISM="Stichococcus sp, Strain RCC1054" /LENGTH=815 /DNA_ID=CAMNT_0053526929 /DNA_START=296 /DNA_END=2743 /DNA_ORIENTATION=-